MIRFARGIVLTGLAFYALACIALYFSQRSMLYYPQPRRSGDAASILTLPADGAQLAISTRPLAGAQAVIYFGGNGEDVSGSVPDLAAAFPKHALFAMHYRGYGGSTGKASQEALFADALLLFDSVHARHPQVTIIGRSLGSGVATYLASVRPTARLVLVTPYDSMVDLAAKRFSLLPVRYLMIDKYETWRYAPLVAAPTTVIAAQHDEVIPRSSTERLLTRFRPRIALKVVIPDSGHNTLSLHPAYTKALAAN